MKGSSFGCIYDTFNGFEGTMEGALDSIFDGDIPPGNTAVAAKVNVVLPPDLPFANPTGFQSIIGCDLTRIFVDNDKKRKANPGLSFADKNAIANPIWLLDGFEHTNTTLKAHCNILVLQEQASQGLQVQFHIGFPNG